MLPIYSEESKPLETRSTSYGLLFITRWDTLKQDLALKFDRRPSNCAAEMQSKLKAIENYQTWITKMLR